MLTNEELQAIKERAEKATAGPWRVGRRSPNGASNVGTMGGLLTAQTTDTENAVFIAHAREDVPNLVEALLQERAEVERLRAESEYWRLEHEHQRRQADMYFSKYKQAKESLRNEH